MLFAQRSPAGPPRATAPLLATPGAAVLGRRQLTRDSASHLEEQRGKQPVRRQAQNQAQSKGGRNLLCPLKQRPRCGDPKSLSLPFNLPPPPLILSLLPHISPSSACHW